MAELRIPNGVIDALPHIRAAASALPLIAEIVVTDTSYVRHGGKPVAVLRAQRGPDASGRLWLIGDPDGPLGLTGIRDRAMKKNTELDALRRGLERAIDLLDADSFDRVEIDPLRELVRSGSPTDSGGDRG